MLKSERLKLLFQGIVLIIIGALFMTNPLQNGAIFLLIVGTALVVIGLSIIYTGLVKTPKLNYKILRVIEGLLIGAFGLIFFLKNPANGAALVIYAVVWSMIVLAILNTIAVFRVHGGIKWLAITLNILVIWFGIQSLLDPQLAVVIFYWKVSLQLIFMGINRIVLYFVLPKTEYVKN